MLPGLLRAVASGVAEGGPLGGLLKGKALSLGGALSDCVPCIYLSHFRQQVSLALCIASYLLQQGPPPTTSRYALQHLQSQELVSLKVQSAQPKCQGPFLQHRIGEADLMKCSAYVGGGAGLLLPLREVVGAVLAARDNAQHCVLEPRWHDVHTTLHD